MEKNILAQMLQEYDSFTRSERKIVDYVLEHQKETQYISITDLSAECEVAVSTVSLFCRKLKLAGFNDFKLELARAALPVGSNPSQLAGEILPGDTPGMVMGKVLHALQDELNNAYHMLAAPSVTRAVDLLQSAGQVVCLGQGNHSVVALAACFPPPPPSSRPSRTPTCRRWCCPPCPARTWFSTSPTPAPPMRCWQRRRSSGLGGPD